MRSIQWHPGKKLGGTRITRKGDPYPQVSASPSKWWLEEDNVLQGQPLCSLKHALRILTNALKEGWGAR